jgi:hypothetical protein
MIEDPWVLPATVILVTGKSGNRLMFELDADQGLLVGVPDPVNVISDPTQTEVGPETVGRALTTKL